MARRVVLDFERPIYELEQRIEEWLAFAEKNGVSVEETVEPLRRKLEDLRRDIYGNLSPYHQVLLARHMERPHALDYLERLCEDFLELHGDRRFADDQAVIGGFGKIEGRKVMVMGLQKGRDVRENIARNFAMPHPEGYRKALRLMRLADKARVPIVTLIDTPGAACDIESEQRHVAEAIAVNLREMFTLSVPIVCIVIGEGGSGGALGVCVGDRVLILEHAYFSVITPEGCAAILWKSRLPDTTRAAAQALKLTATDLLELGVVDEVIPEPEYGANNDYDAAARSVREAILRHLTELDKLTPEALQDARYEKFRGIGVYAEG